MTASELPRRAPGASGRTYTPMEPQPGAPIRDLRLRAADSWEKFMRRAESRPEAGT
ncbi:hypothetical protein [Streptomyces sp. TRM49041]|uniref:hypothetical protein n=1 Tax=Streptomyces sp. TRM49041 TaxID=2603216 RepID=UPI00165689F0|nr:hypothetical protein [Streptomyces sp. TRM49041]